MRKCLIFIRKHLFFTILTLLLFLAFDLYLVASVSPTFAEFFALSLGAASRILLGFLTSWIPFSLMELSVFAIPVAIVLCLVLGTVCLVLRFRRKKSVKTKKLFFGLVKTFLAAVMIGLSFFYINHGINYFRPSLEEWMSLEGQTDKEAVFDTLFWIKEELKNYDGKIDFDENGMSVCPYDFDLLSKKVNAAYDIFAEEKPYLQGVGFDAKEVLTSEYMIYTHISGIYCPYTGEANVNTAYPDYIVADTLAHEYSHQRGVAPEDACNFLAFAVNYSSEEDYLRYSALANAFSSLARVASSVDAERYREIYSDLPAFVRREYRAYSAYFEKYADNTMADMAETLNDNYLKLQGQDEGVLSYQMDARLICLYYQTYIR